MVPSILARERTVAAPGSTAGVANLLIRPVDGLVETVNKASSLFTK